MLKKTVILFAAVAAACLAILSCKAPEGAEKPAQGTAATAVATAAPDVQIGYSGSLAADATFEKCIDAAPVIFKGVCVEKTVNEMRAAADASVRVTEVFRGEIGVESELPVRVNGTEAIKEGGEYLFLTIPMASVYEGIELYYQADTIIPLSEGDSYTGELPDLKGLSNAELISVLEDYVSENDYEGSAGVVFPYCASEDLDEVERYSDVIALVRVESVFLDSIPDRTSYICTVISASKGEAAGNINVVAFKDSMEVGKEYVLYLMGPDDDMYLMSSAVSVQPYVTQNPGN